jgi:DNA-binding XRE family transcriptional regulator
MDALGWADVERTDFWASFFDISDGAEDRTLVIADLDRIARRYRDRDPHDWVASVRRKRPYFVALVRNRKGERCADWVDDLVRHSDLRVSVCRNTRRGELRRCLTEARSALDPHALTEVRYSSRTDRLWVVYGDGTTGSVRWADLGMAGLRDTLVPESATVGSRGAAVELLTTGGELFEVDAGSIKAVVDSAHAQDVARRAATSDLTVGQRVREARRAAGCSQKDLETRTGIDQAIISKLERGKHQPRVDTLRRIADGLQMTLSEILVAEPPDARS